MICASLSYMRANLEHVLDPKVLRIIRVFLNSDQLFHLQTISLESRVPMWNYSQKRTEKSLRLIS